MTNTPRQGRHNPSRERDAPSDIGPLDTRKLAQIWRSLPENDRLPFLLALDEQIGSQMLEMTMPKVADVAPDPWRAESSDVGAWLACQYARMATAPAEPPPLRLDQLSSADLKRVMACRTPQEFAALAAELAAAQGETRTR